MTFLGYGWINCKLEPCNWKPFMHETSHMRVLLALEIIPTHTLVGLFDFTSNKNTKQSQFLGTINKNLW